MKSYKIVIEIMQDTDTNSIHEKLGWIPNHSKLATRPHTTLNEGTW